MTTPADVLHEIPGWQAATWIDLPGGLSNRNFLLENDGRRAVMKIDPAPRARPFNTRYEEFEIQTRAASARLANRPLHAGDTVYLCEYVAGRTWSASDLRDHDKLKAVAGALRSLHALPRSGRRFDAAAAAEAYMQALPESRRGEARQHLDVVRKLPASDDVCFCHNDLVAANILESNGLRFLDFEYACDNEPLFDLATLVAQHGLDDDLAECLLATYFGDDFDANRSKLLTRLAGQVGMYSSLYWLWDAARS